MIVHLVKKGQYDSIRFSSDQSEEMPGFVQLRQSLPGGMVKYGEQLDFKAQIGLISESEWDFPGFIWL